VTASTPAQAPRAPTLDELGPEERLQGFVAEALYVDDDGRARGARLVHERTRFVFDTLVIESAPQAYLYATTYPTSDGGAPHTQEHLLLGKGNKGRFLGNYDHVMLAGWSAATWQFRTAYHFHTSAGIDAFWGILRTQLDALLHPDYSDEEIRREVRNFGVARRPDGTRELDEKGTVYSEMVRTYESASTLGWDALGRLVYGPDHPLALSSGGTPEGIRALAPEAIRQFHDAHYQLANMGMVAAFPSSVPLATVLANVGEVLDALAPASDPRRYLTEADLPPARGAEAGALRVIDYPYATADQPGQAMLAWPATRKLGIAESTLLGVFLGAFAGGEGSTMYEALVDHETRALDVGATGVWAYSNEDPGYPVFFGVQSVNATRTDEASLRAVRDLVLARLRAIAALPDGSPELAAFGERVKARVVEARRSLDKALDTPPQFGERGLSDFWIRQLTELNREGGFRKSLTQRDAFDRAAALASARVNPWRATIAAWGLLDTPYGVMLRASPALRKRLDAERDARVAAELARLEAVYGTKDAPEALRRRELEIAEGTAAIAGAEANVPMPPFVPDPPMTLDDTLAYRQTTVSGVPLVASTFETMKSSTVGLLLRLDGVDERDLPYLALLPELLRDVGVLDGGVPVPYDEVNDRLRREVLGLGVSFDTSFDTGRAELSVVGSGADVEETKRALQWMRRVLASPDWRPRNLPRIRDVVGRRAAQLREVMTGPEEYWANAAAEAYRRQDSALLAHTASFLTRAHDAFRLSWRLEHPPADGGLESRLAALGKAGPGHDRAALAGKAQDLARDPHPSIGRAGRELAQLLGDLPDSSLASDWAYLCGAIATDAASDPTEALDGFRRVLGAIAHADKARVWMVGSSRSLAAIAGQLEALVATLETSPAPRAAHAAHARVSDRARARGATVHDARLVALVNPSTANAALVDSAPSAGFDETRDPALVDFLAANVFSGSGTHSFYKRIWGAALAYSGYVAVHPRTGRMRLYSDRCADLPQLLRFVDGEVRGTPVDPRFVDYAVANTFYARTADTYERRAAAMATDLVEGVTPERVRAFRARLLALRAKPALAESIQARLAPVHGAIIPTLVRGAPVPDGALWFAIGPEPQLARYEAELRAARGDTLAVLRLFPRDFWDPPVL
jgi:Zn-dependent M16 (insulinase) family peptidase